MLYRNDGQGSSDPYRVTLDDKSTVQLVRDHSWNMRGFRSALPRSCPANAAPSPPSVSDDGLFLDTSPSPGTASPVIAAGRNGSFFTSAVAQPKPDPELVAKLTLASALKLQSAYSERVALAVAPQPSPPPRAPQQHAKRSEAKGETSVPIASVLPLEPGPVILPGLNVSSDGGERRKTAEYGGGSNWWRSYGGRRG